MEKVTERYDRLVKAVFGPDARAETSSGTRIKAGSVTIYLADRIIGQAESFQEALKQAMRAVSGQSRREKTQPLTQNLTLGAAFDVACVQ